MSKPTYTTHKEKAASFLFSGFAFAVLAISASTSFSFFYNHFGALLPAGLLDDSITRLISGIVGVLLFDVATAIWLITFLHHAETSEQRAISLIMTVLAFFGAAAASVAHLGLTATGDLTLDPATKETIAIMALVTVIVGVIANFGAAQAYQRFSAENKAAVRESDRRDAIASAEEEQASYLDRLIAQQVKEQLAAVAPSLAARQAQRIAASFYKLEDAKYASEEPLAPMLSSSLPAGNSLQVEQQATDPPAPSAGSTEAEALRAELATLRKRLAEKQSTAVGSVNGNGHNLHANGDGGDAGRPSSGRQSD